MTLVKLPKMDDEEISKALQSKNLCRIAFIEKEFPYISPFQYVYMNETLYFHFTDYGKKKKILRENKNVCVSIEHFEPDLSKYYFISLQGRLELVDNPGEIKQVLEKMIKTAREEFSPNFLSAHGFDKSEGWDAFIEEGQKIYKFKAKKEPIGLKSYI